MQIENNHQKLLYQRYYQKVFGYVIKKVSDRADAEDITSEIFLKILSKPDGFDPNQKGAATYVFRTMQTTLVDFYRKRRILFVPLDEAAESAEQDADYDELLKALDDALDTLSDREQSIVILHYYYGLSHKEIAQRMMLSYANVRQLCHTALQKMKKLIFA